MFAFTTLGDATYLLSVVIFSTDLHFVIQKLPWTAGAAVSLFYDIVVSCCIASAIHIFLITGLVLKPQHLSYVAIL